MPRTMRRARHTTFCAHRDEDVRRDRRDEEQYSRATHRSVVVAEEDARPLEPGSRVRMKRPHRRRLPAAELTGSVCLRRRSAGVQHKAREAWHTEIQAGPGCTAPTRTALC